MCCMECECVDIKLFGSLLHCSVYSWLLVFAYIGHPSMGGVNVEAGNVHYYAAAHILTTDPRLLVLSSQSKFSVSSDLSSVLRQTYGAVSRCTIYERCLPGKELAGALRPQQDLCSQQTIGGSRGTAPYNHNIGHTREGSLKEKKIHIHTLKVPGKRRRVIYQLRIQLKVGIRTGVFIFIDGRK